MRVREIGIPLLCHSSHFQRGVTFLKCVLFNPRSDENKLLRDKPC